MIPTRCQICGRRKGTRADGSIVFHHVAGVPCRGAGFPPIEESDARLAEVVQAYREEARTIRRTLRALEERRANWIDPGLITRRDRLDALTDKLGRRLKRHRDWPTRFARQMERQGWGDPPPAYLTPNA